MKLFNRVIACILVILMLYTSVPIDIWQYFNIDNTASADVTQGETGTIGGSNGSSSSVGGTVPAKDEYAPTFRVTLYREPDIYNDGKPETMDLIIDEYSYKYPSIDGYKESLYFQPSGIDMGSNPGLAYYVSSSYNIRWNTDEETRKHILTLNDTTTTINRGKQLLQAAGYYTTDGKGKPKSELSGTAWQNIAHQITYNEAKNIWNYIFQRIGSGYDADTRLNQLISPYVNPTVDLTAISAGEKADIAGGYVGILMSLYRIAENEGNLYLCGQYNDAIETFISQVNIKEKPVSLIIDTAVPVKMNGLSPNETTTYFNIASIDFLQYQALIPASSDITEFSGTKIRDKADTNPSLIGNTKNQLISAAQDALLLWPLNKTVDGQKLRIADFNPSGTAYQRNIATSTALGRIAVIPGWSNERLVVSYPTVQFRNYAAEVNVGYMESVTFYNNIKGFIFSGFHIEDAVQDLEATYYVNNVPKDMRIDTCTPSAWPKEPNVVYFQVKAASNVLSPIEAKINSGQDVEIQIKGEVWRETYEAGYLVQGKTKMDDLTNQLTAGVSGNQLITFLQGTPMQLVDTTITSDEFQRIESSSKTVTYKYYLENVEITVGTTTKAYTWDTLVKRINGVPMNFAEHQMPPFMLDGVVVPDTVIPKPPSTTDLTIDNPSVNEVDSTLINSYVFNSTGKQFAEIKSNTIGQEEYEVMAGIPSTEEIYFSAGGSEYMLAIVLQYWMNEKGVDRTYRSVFEGDVDCEFNNDNAGTGDTWEGLTVPSASGPSSSDYTLTHNGDGTVTATWTGSIPWTGKKEVSSSCPFGVTADIDTWDWGSYNAALANAHAWETVLGGTKITWTAASDSKTREYTLEPTFTSNQMDSSGSDSDMPSGGANGVATAGSHGDSESCSGSGEDEVCTPIPHGADSPGSASNGTGSTYTITVTAEIDDHMICGPCCGHILPSVEDTWKQGIVFDYVKISQVRLYKIDQASVTGMTEVTGTDEIFASIKQGDPTYFLNIAQLNEKADPKLPNLVGGVALDQVAGHRNTMFSGQNRDAAQSSKYGRLRYSVEPLQHDTVLWEEGPRTNHCDGMATSDNFGKNASLNVNPTLTTGHVNVWADGVLYHNPASSADMNVTTAFEEDYNHHLDPDPAIDKIGYTDRSDADDRKTLEWNTFNNHRRTPNIATVISDFLILQTTGGDQSIFYFEKSSPATETQEHFQKVKSTEQDMFTNNVNSIFNAKEMCSNTPYLRVEPNFINVGGYNGRYEEATSDRKHNPYNLVSSSFLTVGDASKEIKTFLDNDPAQTISRPNRPTERLYLMEDHIQILPTAPNKVYTPTNSQVFYKQVIGYYSIDLTRFNTQGAVVGTIGDVDLGKTNLLYMNEYFTLWGEKMGLTYQTRYTLNNNEPVNSLIVYTPVSTEDATILPIDETELGLSRDQRVPNPNIVDLNEQLNKLKVCPLDPALCEFRVLNCKYYQDIQVADFDFEPTYTSMQSVIDASGNLVNQPTTTPNTRLEGGAWVTTNKTTGIEYRLPAGFTIESAGKVGTGQYLSAFGARWPIPLSDLGISNDKSNRISVSMDLFMNSNAVDKSMLISFYGYDFWLNPNDGATFGIFNTGNGNAGVRGASTVAGNGYNRKVNVELIFGFNNVLDCEAYIDGVKATATVRKTVNEWQTVGTERELKEVVKVVPNDYDTIIANDTLELLPENLRTDDIGSTINVGSWVRNDVYPANFYIDNLEIWIKGGTHEHNSTCYTNLKVHETQWVHEHTPACYTAEDKYTCDNELNANYQHGSDYSNNWYIHSDTSPNNYYGNPSCGYTNGQVICGQTESGTGTYTLVDSDDDGGSGLNSYLSYSINSGKQVKINLGGYSGGSGTATLNISGPGGFSISLPSKSYDGSYSSSGAFTYTFTTTATGTYVFSTSSGTNDPYLGLYIMDGHQHISSCYHTHTGTAGWSPSGCYTVKNTHVHEGAEATSPNGCYTKGTHAHRGTAGLDYANGCYTVPTEHNHITSVSSIPTATYNFSGAVQQYIVPATGQYRLEAWGAQGGNNYGVADNNGRGQGGYTAGTVTLNKGQVLYVYVGQSGINGNPGVTVKSFNGGGASRLTSLPNDGHQGGQGGGATDFRLQGGSWDNASSLQRRILVAGGGGGTGCASILNPRGDGGNLTGRSTYNTHSSYLGAQAYGGTQTAGGSSNSYAGYNGTGGFGYGADGTQCGAGGGGGYYGGGSTYTGGGGGGSSFVTGFAGADTTYRSLHSSLNFSGVTIQQGGRIGNGQAVVTPVSVSQTCSLIASGTPQCTGELNKKTDFNTHIHTAACLTINSDLSPVTFNYITDAMASTRSRIQSYTVQVDGYYTLEAWGASGGGADSQSTGSHAGLGGYTKGTVYLRKGETVYVYVGGKGITSTALGNGGGWNGGGNGGPGGFGGGGATDFRLIKGYTDDDLTSIQSRIMIAGGGGGADNLGGTLGGADDGSGGNGGNLVGGPGSINGIPQYHTSGGIIGISDLSKWKFPAGSVTWDSAEQAYKAVGHTQMYLKPEYAYPIDTSKTYTIKVTAKVSDYVGRTFYWGGERLTASKVHINGVGGTYDYSAASAIATGNTGWVTYTATKQGTAESSSGWGTQTAYFSIGGLLNYSAASTQTTWVKDIELYEDGVLVQSLLGAPLERLGKGENVTVVTDTGGAGGGYYGGLVTNNNNGGAGGGSSFISGYTGCNALDVEGNPSGQPNHISGKKFTDTLMIQGENLGNGYARITPINPPASDIYNKIITGALTEAQVRQYLGDALTDKVLADTKGGIQLWNNWSVDDMKGFKAQDGAILTPVSNNLRLTLTNTSTWEMSVPVNIDNAATISEIKITLDNNTVLTGAGVSKNPDVSGYTSATALANTSNQVLSFKPNWTGAITQLNFDLFSGLANGQTVVVKSIEIIGYGTRTSAGTSASSVIHTWSGWTTSNMKGFNSITNCTLGVSGSNLQISGIGTDMHFDVNTDIDATALKAVRVYLNNNSGATQGQLFYNTGSGYNEAQSVYSNTISANANGQVMTFDLQPKSITSGNISSLRFDTSFIAGGTQTITKIELIGYGTKVAGTGESAATITTVYPANTVVGTYNFTGGVQSVNLLAGTYKFEVWGAQGGAYNNGEEAGGRGGYAYGEKNFSAATNVVITVGGAGATSTVNNASFPGTGGYNGGTSSPSSSYNGTHGGGGGGKTDIAASGTIFIAAGGGGGGGHSAGSGAPGGSTLAAYGSGGIGGYCNNRGAGGSSYIAGVTNSSYSAGQRDGDGLARITAINNITTTTYVFTPVDINYTERFSPVVIQYKNPWTSGKDIILANIPMIPLKLADGTPNPIFMCNNLPFNAHVCTDKCQTIAYLNCTEPHHVGEHYDSSSRVCWEACGDDDNHKIPAAGEDEFGNIIPNADFLQIDYEFTVYFPNRGDFAGNNQLGLSKLQAQTGYGYHNNTDTTEWTREKRVRFPFDVISAADGKMYTGGQWIELEVTEEYFDFYIVAANSEASNASVEFEVEAVNAGSAIPEELQFYSPENPEYNLPNVNDIYTEVLKIFKDTAAKQVETEWVSALGDGYHTRMNPDYSKYSNPSVGGLRDSADYGYPDFFTWKKGVEDDLETAIANMNSKIWNEFNGGIGSGNTNDGSPDNTSINERAKPITVNDNYIRPSNLKRSTSLESLHGGYKQFYIDVVGRIGNFAITDTEDYRFSNFFKVAKTMPPEWLVDGMVYQVDNSLQNNYVGDAVDIRGNVATNTTHWLNTYGTQNWMQGTFESGRSVDSPNLVAQVLTGELNNIPQLKKEQLRFGYDILTTITTIGSYQKGRVLVTPYYYALDLTTGDMIPIDIYISKDGVYQPVNIFNNSINGVAVTDVYDYNLNLDWTTESGRRNYTIQEQTTTQKVAEFMKEIEYQYDSPTDDTPTIISEKPLVTPSGAYNYLGTAQSILLDGKHRTFVGSEFTYGSDNELSSWATKNWTIDKNPGNVIEPIVFDSSAQRWHFKVGVPSSSVFVEHGLTPSKDNIDKIMNDNYGVVSTISVVAIGDIWALEYTQPWVSGLTINGKYYNMSTDITGAGIPPIVAVYSSDKSSILDVDVTKTH